MNAGLNQTILGIQSKFDTELIYRSDFRICIMLRRNRVEMILRITYRLLSGDRADGLSGRLPIPTIAVN